MHLSKTTTLSSVVSILYDRNINSSPIPILDDVIAFHDNKLQYTSMLTLHINDCYEFINSRLDNNTFERPYNECANITYLDYILD